MNVVHIKGNVTRDPELKFTPKGTAVAEFGVAINESYTPEGGEKIEKVIFVDVTTWGRTAEFAAEWFKKGAPILIEGKLQMDEWDDKQTGAKRTKLKVTGNRLHFCGRRKGDDGGEGGEEHQGGGRQQQQRPPARGQQQGQRPALGDEQPDDDDVPF